jgi:hypothetical protein
LFYRKNYVWNIKSNQYKLVSTRRSTVLSRFLLQGFPGLTFGAPSWHPCNLVFDVFFDLFLAYFIILIATSIFCHLFCLFSTIAIKLQVLRHFIYLTFSLHAKIYAKMATELSYRIYSKTMFLDLDHVYYWRFKSNIHINYN